MASGASRKLTAALSARRRRSRLFKLNLNISKHTNIGNFRGQTRLAHDIKTSPSSKASAASKAASQTPIDGAAGWHCLGIRFGDSFARQNARPGAHRHQNRRGSPGGEASAMTPAIHASAPHPARPTSAALASSYRLQARGGIQASFMEESRCFEAVEMRAGIKWRTSLFFEARRCECTATRRHDGDKLIGLAMSAQESADPRFKQRGARSWRALKTRARNLASSIGAMSRYGRTQHPLSNPLINTVPRREARLAEFCPGSGRSP